MCQLSNEEKLKLLKQSIKAYERLLNYRYHIYLAHKGKIDFIELRFLANGFIHLSGISKLHDLFDVITAKGALYRELKTGCILKERISRSIYFEQIVPRLLSIIHLEQNFNNYPTNKYFKYTHRIDGNYSSIIFNYFIQSVFEEDKCHYFIRKIDSDNKGISFVLISTFIENKKDYAVGQQLMTLIRKKIINIITKEEFVITDKMVTKNSKIGAIQ